MNKELIWNLNELFESNNGFYSEIDKINVQLNKITEFKNADMNSTNLLMLLNLKWEIKKQANKVLIYGSLNYYKNINSEETKRMKNEAEQIISKVDLSVSFIDEKFLELGPDKIKKFISENNELIIYELYIKNIFRKKEHVQNEETNSMIKELNDMMNKYLTKYNSIIHEIDLGTINIDGEDIKLLPSNVSKYLSSRNRKTRKDAYRSLNQAYREYEDSLADILNSIYKNRVNICELEKYSSVLEKNMLMKI